MSTDNANQPPKIPDNNVTPSHEWASHTIGTVYNAAEATKGNAPRDEGRIPGAFPGSVSSTDEAEFANTARHVYNHVEKNAKEYIAPAQQNLAQTAQSVYASAEQAARQYLPQGVVNKLEQVGVLGAVEGPELAHPRPSHPADTRPADATSLPSHETGSFHPTHGGVGMLPGTPTESGVAKLPDERLQELRDELPTHESGVFKPTHGGVGSLPGGKDEEGVAMLPEERKSEEQTRDSSDQTPERKGEGYTPTAAYARGQARDTGTENVTPFSSTQKTTTPNAVQFLEANADQANQKPISTTIPGTQAPTTTTGATKNEETSKPGLGTKIKAEAKILSGKMRKDEAKVEEGRAMKQGG